MTTYIVEYQKAFSAGENPAEKEFFDEDEATWFQRAISDPITLLNYIRRHHEFLTKHR